MKKLLLSAMVAVATIACGKVNVEPDAAPSKPLAMPTEWEFRTGMEYSYGFHTVGTDTIGEIKFECRDIHGKVLGYDEYECSPQLVKMLDESDSIVYCFRVICTDDYKYLHVISSRRI